jgi:hypothetical protein
MQLFEFRYHKNEAAAIQDVKEMEEMEARLFVMMDGLLKSGDVAAQRQLQNALSAQGLVMDRQSRELRAKLPGGQCGAAGTCHARQKHSAHATRRQPVKFAVAMPFKSLSLISVAGEGSELLPRTVLPPVDLQALAAHLSRKPAAPLDLSGDLRHAVCCAYDQVCELSSPNPSTPSAHHEGYELMIPPTHTASALPAANSSKPPLGPPEFLHVFASVPQDAEDKVRTDHLHLCCSEIGVFFT